VEDYCAQTYTIKLLIYHSAMGMSPLNTLASIVLRIAVC